MKHIKQFERLEGSLDNETIELTHFIYSQTMILNLAVVAVKYH